MQHLAWSKREIENYLCTQRTLEAYAGASADAPLFIKSHVNAMQSSITEVINAMGTLGKGSPWDPDTKVSDDFLVPLFNRYYDALTLPNMMSKRDFHTLAKYIPADEIDQEVTEKLNAVVNCSTT
ncbi:MAG: hypothetical protein OXC91_05475 [Rhodobacteraceae bacterium]|nr:hypothetical protein [Paracoccaceae bacterium]